MMKLERVMGLLRGSYVTRFIEGLIGKILVPDMSHELKEVLLYSVTLHGQDQNLSINTSLFHNFRLTLYWLKQYFQHALHVVMQYSKNPFSICA